MKKTMIILSVVLVAVLAWGGLTKAGYIENFLGIEMLCPDGDIDVTDEYLGEDLPMKPVIYLYPEKKTDINVRLEYSGEIIADYPVYDKSIKGWDVTAYPDGRIFNHADNSEYSYLFWEGGSDMVTDWDFSTGFVVRGEDIRGFLQKTLSKMGLTPKEYNEFIVYWYPLMKNNKYNLIHFADEQYVKTAPLTITPKPDSMLRVFMVYKSLDEKIDVEKQDISSFERMGFSVVEWGGMEVE